MLQWKAFHYCHTFLLVRELSPPLWHVVRPQLQFIYLYLLMILEWNPKRLVSCGTLLTDIKSNWLITNCHHNFHLNILHFQTFLPLSHAQLPFSLKLTWFRRFKLSFGGFGKCSIMWSSDPHLKHFRIVRSIFLLDITSTARYFSFSFPFKDLGRSEERRDETSRT